ncbi:hypothetical protein BJ508DRAFT_336929 [Ascobolus immersus RN42]|uniref:Uncharacterized protein n=1 Tax=Ascobolus immersus RN42 TaxID=1160509 RepID=A0A3N4H6V9_ASCIM|nr:hypothetical protein BJ508DRAFT_336929 [Ascobolus immersus RN42]
MAAYPKPIKVGPRRFYVNMNIRRILRRCLTQFVSRIVSRMNGRRVDWARWGPFYSFLENERVPDVVQGVRMPRSFAELRALNERQLGIVCRALEICSHHPTSGRPFSRFTRINLILGFVNGMPGIFNNFYENYPAVIPPSTEPDATSAFALNFAPTRLPNRRERRLAAQAAAAAAAAAANN